MNTTNLLCEREDGLAVVTVNRPKALNALNSATLAELGDMARALAADDSVRVVILTGAGDKAFVAGADIAEMKAMSATEGRTFSELGHASMAAMEDAPQPWIAAVNGFALGGGCELAMACDMIYAAKTAKLGQPEVKLGVIPGFGGTQRLLRRVGIGKAKELVYTGEMIGADEALRIGLVDQVVDGAELMARARAAAGKIASMGPLAIRESKRLMQRGQSMSLTDACAAEALAFGALFDTKDQKEGMAAFIDKRQASFEGR